MVDQAVLFIRMAMNAIIWLLCLRALCLVFSLRVIYCHGL